MSGSGFESEPVIPVRLMAMFVLRWTLLAMSVLRWILLAMSILRWILQMSCFLLRSSPVLLRRNHISPVQLLRLPARQHTPVLLSSPLHITDCTIPMPFPLYHLLPFDFSLPVYMPESTHLV